MKLLKLKRLIKRNSKIFYFTFILLLFSFCTKSKKIDKIRLPVSDSSYGIYEIKIKNTDTILDGNFHIYTNNNILKRSGTFVNNEFYGLYKNYFNNGNVESIMYRNNGKDIGEATWYNEDGKLNDYKFYDKYGNLNFYIMYDTNGKISKAKGKVLFEIYQSLLINKEFNIGDTIKYQLTYPNIPKTSISLNIELLDFDNSKIERQITKIEPVVVQYKDIAVKKGLNTIRASIKYNFLDEKNITISDTISFKYMVK